jgi:hypothetical protein
MSCLVEDQIEAANRKPLKLAETKGDCDSAPPPTEEDKEIIKKMQKMKIG